MSQSNYIDQNSNQKNNRNTNQVFESISADTIEQRRQYVFLVLSSVFISAMTLLNIIGITKFVELGPLTVAVGVLPYPLTFLCTDLISELYGRRRANEVVSVGLIINVFIIGVLLLGEYFPTAKSGPPWQTLKISEPVYMANGKMIEGQVEMFHLIFSSTMGAIFASMVAYILAQYIDIKIFHYVKNLTKGKHLWMRNNFSTMISQMVDTVAVISVTFGAAYYRGDITFSVLLTLLWSNYLFKFAAAVLDTGPFYYLTRKLSKYLQIEDAV